MTKQVNGFIVFHIPRLGLLQCLGKGVIQLRAAARLFLFHLNSTQSEIYDTDDSRHGNMDKEWKVKQSWRIFALNRID